MAKYLRWFSTNTGKYFIRSCVGITSISIFGSYIAANGPLLDKVKTICQVYSHGKEKPLSPKVKQLITEVLNNSTLKNEEKNKIKFFNVIGHDLVQFGGKNSPWGCIIGIPFQFEDVNNINFSDLRLVGQEQIDWVVDGQDLLDALTLSDKAKKFGLMREIFSCDFWPILENAVIASMCCVLLPAEFARKVNMKYETFKRFTLRGRIFFYIVCYCFGYLFYRCFKDPMKHISDQKYDRLAAEISSEYLDGGIEFYEKNLLKNKAFRELLGPKGARQFDEKGNENYVIFTPKLPSSKRLEFLKKMKEPKEKV